MLQFLLAHIVTLAAVAACILGVWKGGAPERAGAGLIFGGWFVAMIGYAVGSVGAPYQIAPYVGFTVDGLVAIGFLALALRYSSAWLGIAVLLQAGELALHAAFLTGDGSGARLYIARVNLLGLAVIVLFAAATLNVWLRRMWADRRKANDPGSASPISGKDGDGFPRQAFDPAPVAVPHRLVRR